ncbi:MAG TPA: EamA family transporter [Caldimonas sp.]|nr:EamA family transporter [Caldimonas sp.]
MPSSADGGRAWCALAAALAVGAALGYGRDPLALDWQPALALAEPGRLFSAAFVHYSGLHLLANVAGAALVAALGLVGRVPASVAVAWLLAWPLTHLGLLARPDLVHYGGLSGVLHAGIACVAVRLLVHERGPRRTIAALVLAVVVVKVLSESPWGPALRHPAGWDIATAPFAHASGLVAGVLAALLVEATLRLQGTLRREGLRTGPRLPLGGTDAVQEGSRRVDASADGRKAHLDALAVVILVLCCFLWGLNQVAAKAAMPEIPALWQATLRSAGAALLVWLWAGRRGIALFARDGTLKGGLLAGALFGAEFFCIFVGLQFTTASRMVVFIYISPFVVALGMPLIARSERLTALQGAGLVVAFAGVAWAFAEGFSRPAAGALQWLGDSLGVLAGVLWGATTLAIRATVLGQAPAEKTLFYQLGVSAVLLLIAALLTSAPIPDHLSTLAWGSLAFQTVIVSFASYLVWFWLMRHYPATPLASFTMLTPVFGLILGAVLLAEPVTLRLVIALATVAAGIYLVNRRTS